MWTKLFITVCQYNVISSASIAQWLEHWSCKPGVVSSILTGGLHFYLAAGILIEGTHTPHFHILPVKKPVVHLSFTVCLTEIVRTLLLNQFLTPLWTSLLYRTTNAFPLRIWLGYMFVALIGKVCNDTKYIDPDVIWTRNLLIWSQTRYRCATESTSKHMP